MMTDFEQDQLFDLIELIEQHKPFDCALELRLCGDRRWHVDLTVGLESQIGSMLDDIPRSIQVFSIKDINSLLFIWLFILNFLYNDKFSFISFRRIIKK